jgi:hypothetical protein
MLSFVHRAVIVKSFTRILDPWNPFDMLFDKLTVLSTSALLGVEGLTALNNVEGP